MTNELRQGLEKVMSADHIDEWFNTVNKAFGNKKPCDVVQEGHGDRLWRMIHLLEEGSCI
jgi:hypothetical protein